MDEIEFVSVEPDVRITFAVVTEASFPHGLSCAVCERPIDIGQPFAEKFDGMIDDLVISTLVCVYC